MIHPTALPTCRWGHRPQGRPYAAVYWGAFHTEGVGNAGTLDLTNRAGRQAPSGPEDRCLWPKLWVGHASISRFVKYCPNRAASMHSSVAERRICGLKRSNCSLLSGYWWFDTCPGVLAADTGLVACGPLRAGRVRSTRTMAWRRSQRVRVPLSINSIPG